MIANNEFPVSPVYQGSIHSLLQQSGVQPRPFGFVLAVTSAHGKSGVTHFCKMLEESLNRDQPGSALRMDCRALEDDALPEPPHGKKPIGNAWRGNPEVRAAAIQKWRQEHAYLILDCPPINESSMVLSVSQHVDGIVSVVEANRTTRSQIRYLERTVQQMRGKLLGHVLKKRTYLIPEWLQEKMERIGI